MFRLFIAVREYFLFTFLNILETIMEPVSIIRSLLRLLIVERTFYMERFRRELQP